jgi:hypothetical protein
MRKLKNYLTGMNIDLTEERFYNTKCLKFKASDLLLSVLIDKRLNSTEKAILGIIFDESFSSKCKDSMSGNFNLEYFVSDITVYKDTVLEIEDYINTKYLCIALETSKRTIFNNLYSLIDKGIISFGREGFSEYGKIRLNIGFLISEYYR